MNTTKLDLLLRAFSNKTRREILCEIETSEKTISQVASQFNMSLQAISVHLKVLEDASLIKKRKEGLSQFVSLKNNLPHEVSALMSLAGISRKISSTDLGNFKSWKQLLEKLPAMMIKLEQLNPEDQLNLTSVLQNLDSTALWNIGSMISAELSKRHKIHINRELEPSFMEQLSKI